MKSPFFFSLESLTPQKHPSGSLTYVTAKDVPGFVNISFSHLRLNPKGALAPVWHPNANKMGYCADGKALVSMRTPTGVETFTVQKGEIFFIPQGYIHTIENMGEKESVIYFALDHAEPQEMHFAKAIYSLSDAVFSSTFNISAAFLDGLKSSKNEESIKSFSSINGVPNYIVSRYKFDIQDSTKPLLTRGGYLQLGTKINLPTLQGLGLLGFGLNPEGSVEPHWHTNAGELVYILQGKTRITILSPDGHVEELEVSAGEGAFAPASYFHYIENIGSENVEVLAFFNHAEPDYIGIGEVMGSYSNELLASIFNVAPDYFDTFKKPTGPLVIVPTE